MENTTNLIYKEFILDLYRNPLNKGILDVYDIRKKGFNPSCGDEIDITMKLQDGKITEIMHDGAGCAISEAAASLITDEVKGKTIDDVLALGKENVVALLGIEVDYTRTKCALLALQTIQESLKEYGTHN